MRGLHPYPIAYTFLDGKKLKVYQVNFVNKSHNHPVGKFFSDYKKYLAVSVIDGYIELLEIKLQGKRQMMISDFLNGYTSDALEPIL